MTTNLPSTQVNWESEIKGAAMLVKSGLTPKDIRTPEAALFVILAGRDLGLSPVQSLRSIRCIQGKIECSADLQLGLFHRDGGRSKWLKLDQEAAWLELSAPWLNQPHVSKFGVEEAKRAELMSNANYKKFPQAMFRSRAITQGLKDIGFLAGSGVYAPGEISGGNVTIDAQTGEVLPGEAQPENMPKGTYTASMGTVERLEDDQRKRCEELAAKITEHVGAGAFDKAFAVVNGLDDTDEKVAIWALLDKGVQKAYKAAQKAGAAHMTSSALPTRDPNDGGLVDSAAQTKLERDLKASVDINEVRKCLTLLDFDGARDLARHLPAALQTTISREIEAAEKAANTAEQP